MIILTFCSAEIYSKNHIIWDGTDSGRQITQELLYRESPNHKNPSLDDVNPIFIYLTRLDLFLTRLDIIFRGYPDVLNIFGTDWRWLTPDNRLKPEIDGLKMGWGKI